ncbi:MAG: hypothetical protein FJZ86_18755 [Chloroflexi bacterium]|nr:hypothetical protein [Chloroflexota bacterium]
MNKNKVVFVQAYFAPIGKEQVVKVPTGEKKKGFLGGESDVTRNEKKWVQTGFSDSEIDTSRLTKDLQEAVERLNKEGYEVVSVTQIISGAHHWAGNKEMYYSYAYGYGYSYTDGLMVIARKA